MFVQHGPCEMQKWCDFLLLNSTRHSPILWPINKWKVVVVLQNNQQMSERQKNWKLKLFWISYSMHMSSQILLILTRILYLILYPMWGLKVTSPERIDIAHTSPSSQEFFAWPHHNWYRIDRLLSRNQCDCHRRHTLYIACCIYWKCDRARDTSCSRIGTSCRPFEPLFQHHLSRQLQS